MPTRKDLTRVLVVNAMTKPVNVTIPAAVLTAGLLLAVPWLIPVALVCWLALVVMTFFDEREAESAFAPEIAARLRAANAARASIRLAVGESVTPLDDVAREVDALVLALDGHATRAQRIRVFLAEESPAQLRERIAREPSDAVRTALESKLAALDRLQRRLTRLLEEMDHVVATLQTVHAEILATDGLEQGTLAGQVSELRANVQIVSAGLEDAFAATRA